MSTPGRPEQREAFLVGAVEHVLAHGVGTLSLRPLAAALGTSDRMLLYYFGSRHALLAAVLERVSGALLAGLTAGLPPGPLPPAALLAGLWEVGQDPRTEPALRLYVEVLGLAAARRPPFDAAARGVALGWLAWARERVDVPEAERDDAAAGVLAAVDGLLLLRLAVGPEVAERAARRLVGQADPG